MSRDKDDDRWGRKKCKRHNRHGKRNWWCKKKNRHDNDW
jgi:hypothetical protein